MSLALSHRRQRGRRPWRGQRLVTTAVTIGALVTAGAGAVALSPAASADTTLLSQGRAATASSAENPDYTAARAAFDGNLSTTRWSSAFSDPQWLEVDLGASDTLSQVVLTWEAAYASAYSLQSSTDGTTWKTMYSTTSGHGGTETDVVSGTGRYVRMLGTKRATGYGYSLWEMQVYGTPAGGTTTGGGTTGTPNYNLDPGESITVSGYPTTYSTYVPPVGDEPSHHEFQANCSVAEVAQIDPIVYPKQSGPPSHIHTILGNASTSPYSTDGSLFAAPSNCTNFRDHSAYWFPTLYNGSQQILPTGPQVIYYKSGVADYTSVVPFPKGLRFVVGSAMATEAQFQQSPGAVDGWECGNSSFNWDFPKTCPAGSQLNIRYQSPSCWDGVHLDSPDHRSHMAYPVDGHCTASHPVALPMLEFKIAFPVSGDMSNVHLYTGAGFTWHYDFFNAWDPAVLKALVTHCINGGLQCNTQGYDLYKPDRGAALDANFEPVS